MQVGLEINEYKRVKENKGRNISLKEEYIFMTVMFFAGVLISRVIIYYDQGNLKGIAPFGVAYLIAVISSKDEKKMIVTVIATAIGYLTISNNITYSYVNIIIGVLMVFSYVVSQKIKRKVKEVDLYLIIFLGYLIYGIFINGYDFGVNLTMSLINTIVVVPVYYIVKYGMNCIEEFNTNYFFSAEEIISIGIVLCLVVAGIGNVNIMGISIRNIVAYSMVLIIAFVGGGAYGSALGVVMGAIVGMNSGDMTLNIAFYSIAGLIAGIFKDTGKLFSFLSYMIMYLAISFYSQNLDVLTLVEVTVAGGIFMAIPKKVFNRLEVEIDTDKKRDQFSERELSELKKEFAVKVEGLGGALLAVSNTLTEMGNNEKLMYKSKSAALIENLADRVCSSCGKCNKCWDREFNLTYNSFHRLIKGCEENKIIFPGQLEKICPNKFDLIKGAERIVANLNNNEILKTRLSEGRLLIADHIKNLSISLDNMLCDFKRDVSLCGELERTVKRALNKNNIEYKNVFCYRDSKGREKIRLTLESCGGGKYCSKKILPIINEVMNVPMSMWKEGCKINPDNNECVMIFEEAPKFHVVSYGAISAKNDEEYTGDTYSFGRTNDGSYMAIISDGMGSGPEASKESSATVEVIEKFIEAGFNKDTAIGMVNSIMAMKFEEDEKFTTLDLNMIDLYTGEATFTKIGAVASFIKRGSTVKIIESNMPPFGLVDKVEMEDVKENIKSGDIIVTLSDGVVDIDKTNIGKYIWIEKFLQGSTKDPKELASDIIDKAKELSGGKSNDDMTVVVSKVYSMY